MSRTKVVGWLIVVGALVKVAIDALDGNGFNFSANYDAIAGALAGAGFVFLRDAVGKIQPKK